MLATSVSLSADRVRLRSGKVIEGMFMGADSTSVRVLLDDGQVSEMPIADAVAVEFGAEAGAAAGSQACAEASRRGDSRSQAAPAAAPRWLRCRPARQSTFA